MKDERWSTAPCYIEKALSKVGDAWTLLILRDASRGALRFEDFRLSLGIASNILTRKLGRLVTAGLLERVPYQSNPPRFNYVLTHCGRDFLPVLHVMSCWGRKHFADASTELQTPDDPFDVVVIERATGLPIDDDRPV